MVDVTASSVMGERRARSLAGARMRSLRVKGLRYTLLIVIAGVIANAAWQLIQSSMAGTPEAGFAPAGSNERIVNPRFTGRDENGAPFVVTADAAVRRIGGVAGVADLEFPTLDYQLIENDDTSLVLAESGEFDEAAQTLLLRDNVRLTTRSGYAFETDAALVRLREGRLEGRAPVVGFAPWGAVRASEFDVRDDGEYIIMTGDVRTRIEMNDTPENPE